MLMNNLNKRVRYTIRRGLMALQYRLGSKQEYIPPKREIKERALRSVTGFDFGDRTQSKNIIIVTIDCMRYWSTTQAGYERDTTPFFSSFGTFLKAYTAAPWTYPSVPSILTGKYPHNHGAYLRGKFKNFTKLEMLKRLKSSVPLITDILELLNYNIYVSTAIDPVSYVLRGRVGIVQHHYLTPGQKVLETFLQHISKSDRPFFAYLHLGDPHEPLNPPKGYREYFGKVKNLPNIDTWNYHFSWERERDPKGFENYKYNRILLYDNVLRYVNDTLEWFIDRLDGMGVLDDSLVIITADHGEEFWEHAETEAKHFKHAKGWSGISHGHNVFAEIIDVPLLIGGYTGGRKIKGNEPRSLVDITPTILDLLDIQVPENLDGVSLFRKRKEPVLSEGVSSGYEKKTLIDGKMKLLYAPDDGVKWLFDHKEDPRDKQPLEDPERLKDLEKKLKSMMVPKVRIRL